MNEPQSGTITFGLTIMFFLSFHQSGHFWNLIIQFYVWFLADQWGSVPGYSSIVYVSIDPYPRTQSRSSGCSTSGIFRTKWHVNSPVAANGAAPDLEYSPVAAVLVQIWHILNFRQDSSWFSSPPVSQASGLTCEISPASFFSQLSSIWPFLKFDYPVLRMISRPPERLSSWIQQ